MKKIILAAMVSTVFGASFFASAAMAEGNNPNGLQGSPTDMTCIQTWWSPDTACWSNTVGQG